MSRAPWTRTLIVVLGLGCLALARPGQVYAPGAEERSVLDPACGRDVPSDRYLDLGAPAALESTAGYEPAPLPWQREVPGLGAPREEGRYLDLGALAFRDPGGDAD